MALCWRCWGKLILLKSVHDDRIVATGYGRNQFEINFDTATVFE